MAGEDKHKRYLVFAYEPYYPSGGLGDVHASYGDADEAVAKAKTLNYWFVEVWDRIDDVWLWQKD